MALSYAPDPFVTFRHELHRFPDLSGQESATQQRVSVFVSQFNPDDSRPIGGTGLLVRYGSNEAGPVTLIRADIDALPIQEVNDFGHRSTRAGVSHKCGHDGHTAILTRLASLLDETPVAKGRVYLLFQPAEETGQGAEAVLNDPLFTSMHPDRIHPDRVTPERIRPDRVHPDRVHPDRVFALHNLPGFPAGTIVCKPGPFTASVLSIIVTFTGAVSHSAEPEKGRNPAYVMADFTLQSRALQQPDPQTDTFALITPVYTMMGEPSYGVSAGYGEVHLTLRTRTADRMDALKGQLLDLLDTLTADSGIRISIRYTEAFVANENDPAAFEPIRQCAEQLGFSFQEVAQPFRWGEDFGLFTQRFRGAMFGIGAGENTPALHNDDYDFNDALIEPAARMFRALIDLAHA